MGIYFGELHEKVLFMKNSSKKNSKRIVKKLLVSFLVITFVFTLIFPFIITNAEPKNKETVRIGYYENEIFEEGAKEGAVKSGYAYEYYRKLSEYTGWNYEYVYGDFDKLYEKLLSGEIDFLAGLVKNQEREALIGYPNTPMGNENYMLVKHSSDAGVTSDVTSIAGKKIGVLKSAIEGILNDYLKANNITAEVVTFDNYDDLFAAFDNKLIDILAAEGDGAYNREDAEVISIFGKSDYYLCVNKNRQDLLDEVNVTINNIQMDDPSFLTSLQNKYYSSGFAGKIYSDEERAWINSHTDLKVGYLNNYLPYSATDKNGEVTGMVKDIVPAILSELNLSSINVIYTGYDKYSDMIADVVSGKLDVVFPVGGGLYYSEENGIYQSTSVANASTDLVYKGEYNEKTEKHFAVNENNKMQYYYITTNFPNAEITFYPSIDACLDAVLSGDVTATTLNGLRANDIIKNRRYNSLYLKQLSTADERCFGIAIGDEGLLRLINHGLSLVGSDFIVKTAYTYAGELYEYTFLDMVTDHLAEFLIAIIVIILIVIFLIARDWNRTKRANKLKSDFLSNMSHEIRTPITAILGMNEMIQMESDDENILNYSNNIDKAGNNLLGIINDILDISKIESGKMELYTEKYKTQDLISEICAMTEQTAVSKGLSFDVEVDEKLPMGLVGDVKKLRQITMNLLSNAVKYTNEGKVELQVKLKSSEDNKAMIEVAIEDTGIGIKEEDKERLYKEFDRLDLEKNNTIEGTGLGLAISEKLLDMMGSEIKLESTYGKGSKFYFTIEQEIYDATPIGDYSERIREQIESIKKEERVAFNGNGARILVVDDTPMNLSVISGLLKNSNVEIYTAQSGEECIKKLEDTKFDLIFLDQRMPNMDGMETLSELNKRYPTTMESTPVIALTANVLSGNKETMLGAGFTDYLTKPVKRETLENALRKYLSDSVPKKGIRQIDGLDVDSGIDYCGDEEDYIYALELYIGNVNEKTEEIRKYVLDKNYKELSILIHSLKSTSLSIGAKDISELAKELEEASDNSNEEFITDNYEKFITNYETLTKQISDALGE